MEALKLQMEVVNMLVEKKYIQPGPLQLAAKEAVHYASTITEGDGDPLNPKILCIILLNEDVLLVWKI